MMLVSFRLIFLSALTALVIAPLAIRLAPMIKLVDIPGSLPHKQHTRPMPLVGGWVLLVVTLLIALPAILEARSELLPVVWASLLVFLFGTIDDRIGLSAPIKFAAQLTASIVVLVMGVQVQLFPSSQNWLNIGLTLFWLVGITNAFNFVDSMDGLAVGLAGISAGFFMLVTQEAGQGDIAALCAVLLGASIGVYYFNSRPARMFLGDAGSQWLGFLLAGIAIIYTPQGFLRSQSWFVPILLMGVPIFDTVLVVFSRVRRRQPWYLAHLDHTYHRLVHYGMDHSRAVLMMHTAELLLSCLAFVLLSLRPIFANMVFGTLLAGGTALVVWMDSRRRWV